MWNKLYMWNASAYLMRVHYSMELIEIKMIELSVKEREDRTHNNYEYY
jgi:hypothetical protein